MHLAERLDRVSARAFERTQGPSINIVGIESGEAVYRRAFGNDRVEQSRRASGESVYNIASLTKQFTATCVLLLQERGMLRVDDLLCEYLPELPESGRITLRHLLTHSSGYRDYYPLGYADDDKLSPELPEQIVARYAAQPLQFEPGSAWSYSNTGFHILGLVVELVSGMRFGKFLTQNVLQPAGLSSSFFNDPPRTTATHALGYTRFSLGPMREARAECAGWMYSSGGIASTAADLATWCISLMEHRLLEQALFEEMTTPYRMSDGALSPVAMGWFIERHGDECILQHSGGLAGFASQIIMEPRSRTAVVVLSNGDHVQVGTMARELFGELTGIPIPVPVPSSATFTLATLPFWIECLQRGNVERERLTTAMNSFLDEQHIVDARDGLALGAIASVQPLAMGERGGMSWTKARVAFADGTANVIIRETADGRLAEFNAYPIP